MTALVAALRRRHAPVTAMWRANPGSGRAYALVTVWTLYAGAVLVFGAPERTRGPAYRVIQQAGGPLGVGVVLLCIAALLVAAPSRYPLVIRGALLTGGAMHVALAGSFAWASWTDQHAGLLAPGLLSVVVLWSVSQAELYRRKGPDARGAPARPPT